MTDVMEAGRRPAIALSVYTGQPSTEVAELLGITIEDKVAIRRRLRLVDDQAYAISVAHFAPWAVAKVPELASPVDLQPGPAALTDGVRQLHDIIRTTKLRPATSAPESILRG